MKRGFRIRIYPTEEQKELLSFYCKTAHNMWNFLVAKYKDKLPVCNCYGIKDYTPRDLINEFGVEIPQRIAFGVMKTYCDAVKRRFDKIGNAFLPCVLFQREAGYLRLEITDQKLCSAGITAVDIAG